MTEQIDMFPDAKMDSPELIYRREQEAKYEAFKKRNDIYTHFSDIEEKPWFALASWNARRSIEGCRFISDPVEIIAEYAEFLDDNGFAYCGQTEVECVKWLAFRWRMSGMDDIDWSVITE